MANPRPIWTGDLVIGDAVRVPVRMYDVPASPTKVSFNHAHRCGRALTRIQQKKWCPTCRVALTQHDVARVFEHGPGQYLEITDAEIATCETVDKDHALRLVSVFEAALLHPLYIDSTSYLIPDDAGAEAFEAVRLALGARLAQATLVLQKRLALVALSAGEAGLVVYHLRTAEQVAIVPRYPRQAPAKTHIDVMRRYLQQLDAPFAVDKNRDTYHERVRALLTHKIAALSKAAVRSAVTRTARGRK